jgi:hypothetical protein
MDIYYFVKEIIIIIIIIIMYLVGAYKKFLKLL